MMWRSGRHLALALLLSLATLPALHNTAWSQRIEATAPAAQSVVEDSTLGRRSFVKALTYQAIVVTTDQILYSLITASSPSSNLGFFFANIVSGVLYYDFFEDAWHQRDADSVTARDELNKAAVYRVFDTARVFAVAFSLGTPISQSLGVTAASAAVRTGVYVLHDYAWSFIGYGQAETRAEN